MRFRVYVCVLSLCFSVLVLFCVLCFRVFFVCVLWCVFDCVLSVYVFVSFVLFGACLFLLYDFTHLGVCDCLVSDGFDSI